MTDDQLVRARKRAERAVEDMKEGSLKVAAFQAILGKLLTESDVTEQGQSAPADVSSSTRRQPGTLTERVLAIKVEGFFKTQRSLGEIRNALGTHGWHYPLTTLSGVMQSLVQQRQLRRERAATGTKKVWEYSDP